MPKISHGRFFIGFGLLIVFLFGSIGFSAAATAGSDLLNSSIVADIAEASSPKVVWITTTYEKKESPMSFPFDLKQFFGEEEETTPSQGLGSGFFFNEQGYILTNAHVVDGAASIEVTLQNQKEPHRAKLIGLDKELDVAVIKIENSPKMPFLSLGNSDQTRIGDWAIAIGNPYGLDHTVTLGIISAKGRPIVAGKGVQDTQTYENMIQTDAPINPGSSGGPLLNLKGEVIGINTAVSMTGQGLGFAIPVNAVADILDELISKGKVTRPWLGVALLDIKTLDPKTKAYLNITKNEGILIKQPLKDSPAAKAGIKPYDQVLEINHQPVNTVEEFIKFIKQKTKIGDTVKLLVLRGNDLMVIDVTLAEKD